MLVNLCVYSVTKGGVVGGWRVDKAVWNRARVTCQNRRGEVEGGGWYTGYIKNGEQVWWGGGADWGFGGK